MNFNDKNYIEFKQTFKTYFDEGIFKELYSDDLYTFVNFANVNYLVYTRQKTDGKYYGLEAKPDIVDLLYQTHDYDAYNCFIDELKKRVGVKELARRFFDLNESKLDKARYLLNEHRNNCTQSIDLNLDIKLLTAFEELKNKNNKVNYVRR